MFMIGTTGNNSVLSPEITMMGVLSESFNSEIARRAANSNGIASICDG
jgi:hypothetical protein